MSGDDAKIREHFDALRRQDDARAPDFATTLTQTRARAVKRPQPRAGWWLATAAAAGVALLWLVRVEAPPTTPAATDDFAVGTPSAAGDFAVGGWRMPTDVLLETPGIELLGSPGWEPFADPAPGGVGPQSRIRGRSHG